VNVLEKGNSIVLDGILRDSAPSYILPVIEQVWPGVIVADPTTGLIVLSRSHLSWGSSVFLYPSSREAVKKEEARRIYIEFNAASTKFSYTHDEDERLIKHIITTLRAAGLVQEQKPHPRNGYVVALYVGIKGRLDEDEVLIEVFETYNVWGQESSKKYHYQSYHLRPPMVGEVKTIGSIDPPAEGSHQPPSFVLGQYKGYDWRRLR